MRRMYQGQHLSYQVNMIRHNYKSIKPDPFVFNQEPKTVYNYIFILIWL